MLWVVVGLVLGAFWVFAYVPIFLIVNYTVRHPAKVKDKLFHAYIVEDSISTEQFIQQIDEKWADIKHAPLR